MNAEPTPATWSLITGPQGQEIAALHAADINGQRCGPGEVQANAALIAAAPDLRKACQLALGFVTRHHTKIDGANLLARLKLVLDESL